MKKVLFIIPNLSHGGTNKCLENILPFLCKSYDISIISLMEEGIYKERFTPYNLFPLNIKFYKTKRNLFFRIINRLSNNIFLNILFKKHAIITERKLQPDLVVAFQEGNATLFTSHFTQRKIAWIHCDYKLYNEIFKPKISKELKLFLKFEKIICVSNTTQKSYNKYFPTLKQNTEYIYNILNIEEIKKESKEIISDNIYTNTEFTLISVGRYHYVKQFEKIPSIVNEIIKLQKDIKLRWYIIGDGDSFIKKSITTEINKYNLQDKIICLGSKNNPYPYIKKANLLVVTSLSEAYPCVINEAKILKTPVLVSNFDSAHEIVDDNTGIIAPLNDFPKILYNIINDINGSYSCLKNKVNNYEFSNDENLDKLYKLFNT